MDQAAREFAAIQARGRLQARNGPDPRPALAAALMQAIENEIPWRLLKPFPTLLTRLLCGGDATGELDLNARLPLAPRLLFTTGLYAVRGFDAVVRLLVPGFSITRMCTRVLGYRLVARFLMDQTRPLRLPPALLQQVAHATRAWRHDPQAPRWVNRLETRLNRRADAAADSAAAGTGANP